MRERGGVVRVRIVEENKGGDRRTVMTARCGWECWGGGKFRTVHAGARGAADGRGRRRRGQPTARVSSIQDYKAIWFRAEFVLRPSRNAVRRILQGLVIHAHVS